MNASLGDLSWLVPSRRLAIRPATAADLEDTWEIRRLESVGRWMTSLSANLDEFRKKAGWSPRHSDQPPVGEDMTRWSGTASSVLGELHRCGPPRAGRARRTAIRPDQFGYAQARDSDVELDDLDDLESALLCRPPAQLVGLVREASISSRNSHVTRQHDPCCVRCMRPIAHSSICIEPPIISRPRSRNGRSWHAR